MLRAMIRMGLLLTIGVGSLALPGGSTAWLLGAILVAALAISVPDWWRRPRTLTLRVEPMAHHFHYCAGCDEQWEHAGEGAACVEHWAVGCPECRDEAAPPLRGAA
jgi:hypothetical protein